MCEALLGNSSSSLDQNERGPALWVGVNIILQFSKKQKAAEDEDNLFETSRSSYKDGDELVLCNGKHNLTVYLVRCGLKLQDVLNTAVWLRGNILASCKN
jgi:hypothetical protein